MPLLKRLTVIAAKTESVIGTPETLTASEGAYNPYNISIQPDIEVEEREDPGSFNRRKAAPSARGCTINFTTDIQWDGTSTPPTWASVLFPACGWVDTTGTFNPVSEYPGLAGGVKTLTIGVYMNGLKKFAAGCVGNFTAHFPSGKVCFIDWEFRGVWQPPVDATMLVVTHPTDDLIRYATSTTTWDGTAQCPAEVMIESGNTLLLRECPSTAAGYVSGVITDRSPRINLDPEAELEGTDPVYADWILPTEGVFSLTAGTTMTWAAPKAQLMNVQEGERDKLATNELEFSCNKNADTEDQELSITFA